MGLQDLAKKFPFPIKQSIKYIYSAVPLRFRLGKVFWDTYNLLKESQWWSRERLEDYQLQQLQKLLNHAYTNVPYYRRVFEERGIRPKDIKVKEDLAKLPLLTKDIVRNNINDLLARNMKRKEFYSVKTSGSTVSPLSFFWHRNVTASKEDGFIFTVFNIAGYRFNEKRVYLSFEQPANLTRGFWQYNPLERVMSLYASTLSEDILHSYVKTIRKFQPKVIKGIPSNLVVLADFLQKNNISELSSVEIVHCASEQIYPWQKELIEEAFQCRLFSHYGQAEAVILATECEVNSQYHLFPEYGITEIVGSDDLPVKAEGTGGRIIGTGFNNYAMPFIRYYVGDIAAWSNKTCQCGRNYPLLRSIEGRESEYIVTRNGDLIPMIVVPYSSIMKNIKQFQFYQEVKGKVRLRLIPLPAFTERDAKRIISSLSREIKNVEFKLEYADILNRTERGKYKYIIQKLPIKFGNLSS